MLEFSAVLAAISHIDFTYRFHISISHITAKLEASFSVNGEQHTHLFGLFFDWLRLASASSSIGFDWLRPLLLLLRLASIGFGLFFVWAIGTLDKAMTMSSGILFH